VYKKLDTEDEDYVKLVKIFKVNKVYVGNDGDAFSRGNSILLEIQKNKYVCITADIFEFELEKDDEMVKYFSEIGNSDVAFSSPDEEKGTLFLGKSKKRLAFSSPDEEKGTLFLGKSKKRLAFSSPDEEKGTISCFIRKE